MEGPSALCTQRDDAASKTLYESDEFRIYCFKILPCSRRYAHDWSACQFAHPNEKAKRRNLRTHKYDCEMCPAVAKGEECPKGPSCPHSHNVFESWLHPQKYRTLLCKDKERCNRAVCFFAHGSEQLRIPCDPIPYMHAPADKQLPAALAGLLQAHSTASSGYSTALSHHGSSSSLVLPAGSPLGTAVSNISSTGLMLGAGPTPGPTAAASSESLMITENVEQLLSKLMEEVQLARKEAEQSREAALEAGEKLRMVTAVVAGTGGQPTAGGFSRNSFPAQPFVAPAASSYIADTTMPGTSPLFGGQMMATGLAQTPGCSSAVTTMSTNLGWTTGMGLLEQAGSSPQTYPTSTFDVSLGPAATMSDTPGMYGSPGDSMSSITGSINSMLGGFIGASSPAVPAALSCGQLPVNSGTSQRLGGLPLAHQQSVLLPGFAGAMWFAGGNGVRQSAAQATYF